jgi:hypothetical protein
MQRLARVMNNGRRFLRQDIGYALLCALSACALSASSGTAGSPPSLCRIDERVIFACSVAGSAKLISLCSSSAIDPKRGYLQYRFGKLGAVELQFPQARANTQLAFRYAHYFRAQVDRSEIGFDNKNYRYVIFDYFEGDVKPSLHEAGIRISRHGELNREQELKCSGTPLSKLGTLESVIARDPDNPLNQ